MLDVDQINAGPVSTAKNSSSESEQARAGVVALSLIHILIRRIVPKNALGIDIDIFAPDVVCYRDISVARCFTVYSLSLIHIRCV